ncbi:MAG: FixH family protein [Bacteroidia bacterium]
MTKNKRSLWPFGIIGALLVFAIFIVSVAVYISNKNVDLESKEYYLESVAYNDIIKMKKAYESLAQKPELHLNDQNQLSIKFPNDYWSKIDSGRIDFLKPDNAVYDFTTAFKKPAASSIAFPLKDKKSGVWKVKFMFSIDTVSYFKETEISLK